MQNQSTKRDGEPRITPLKVEDFNDELMAIILQMAEINKALDSREKELVTDLVGPEASAATQQAALPNLPEIIPTMLRHPQLFSRLTNVGAYLLGGGTLPPRDRELAILRIGWICKAPYEFGEHVIIAKKHGVTSEEVERVTQGAQADGWTEHERVLMRAVEELYADAMISDETWAMLAKVYDDKQMIELPVLIGQYQAVAYYQNSLRLRPHNGNLGLDAR